MKHSDADGGTEADAGVRGNVVHCVEDHLCGLKETTICHCAGRAGKVGSM